MAFGAVSSVSTTTSYDLLRVETLKFQDHILNLCFTEEVVTSVRSRSDSRILGPSAPGRDDSNRYPL